jgi:phospholipid-binding lipoprotein MlaA
MLAIFRFAAVLYLGLGIAGCASTPSSGVASSEDDPYEATNRQIFDLNQSFDKNLARPVAVFYNHAVPEPARDGVHNFLTNLDLPVTFANDVLQGEATRAGETLGRFTVNSTIGIGGLVDAAGKIGIPEHDSDFGETLAAYGVGEGPYLVLPLIGPSNPRDGVGTVADIFLDPTTYVTFQSSIYFQVARGGLSVLDLRARNVDTLDEIERSSVDLYATERSLYRQHRQAEINHGKPNMDNLPNF